MNRGGTRSPDIRGSCSCSEQPCMHWSESRRQRLTVDISVTGRQRMCVARRRCVPRGCRLVIWRPCCACICACSRVSCSEWSADDDWLVPMTHPIDARRCVSQNAAPVWAGGRQETVEAANRAGVGRHQRPGRMATSDVLELAAHLEPGVQASARGSRARSDFKKGRSDTCWRSALGSPGRRRWRGRPEHWLRAG